MASHQTTSNPSNSIPIFDELRWVTQISRTFDEELEEEEEEEEEKREIPVSIFSVPKTLISINPAAYIPQQVSLGPYHHWRPELYDMERYKLSSAKRTHKKLQTIKFKDAVARFLKLEPEIRACYHRYIDFDGGTIAWIMAIDTSFLLEFLHVYAVKDHKVVTRLSSNMSHLIDYSGLKLSHNAILRDIVMLENQIPLFLLRKMLGFQFSSTQIAEEALVQILMGFSKELSLFKSINKSPQFNIKDRLHLLDLLYYIIVPNSLASIDVAAEAEDQNRDAVIINVEEQPDNRTSYIKQFINIEKQLDSQSSYVKHFIDTIRRLFSKLKERVIRWIKGATTSIPSTIVTKVPAISIMKGPIGHLFAQAKETRIQDDENANHSINKPPLIEEIAIPSVSELCNAGVRFCATNGDLSTIKFDLKTFTFYLPTVSLDVNMEVVLRNLVAYEASSAQGPLVLTRYTELMNGIIDTEDDVRLLREKGIVLNRMKSDGEVAALWNGMSKSVKLTKVPFLDKVIEDVNGYYDGLWRVKLGKFMKRSVFGCWPFLTLLGAVVFLLFTGLQALCTVYGCSRYFHGNNLVQNV